MGKLNSNVEQWAARYQAREAELRSTCPHPKALYDYATSGIDEYLQGYGGDPTAGQNSLGLRIPSLATVDAGDNPLYSRYLFALCSVQVGHARRRLVGIGQYATIGWLQSYSVEDNVTHRSIECQIMTPSWRFDNGNLSYALTVHTQPPGPIGQYNADSFSFNNAPMGLLYQDATFNATDLNIYGRPDYYTSLIGYVPPNNGVPYGTSLVPALGTFYDTRFPWNYGDCLGNIDVEVEGPCTVTLWASCRQRDTERGAEVRVVSPNDTPLSSGYGGPEEAFLQNFPDAIYWRVAGRMIWEDTECANGTCGGNTDNARFYSGLRVIDGGLSPKGGSLQSRGGATQ